MAYPKLALYKLGGLSASNVATAAMFDIVVAGPEYGAAVPTLHYLNPDAKAIFYRASQEREDDGTDDTVTNHPWWNDAFFLLSDADARCYQWGTINHEFNCSDQCPTAGGYSVHDVLAAVVATTYDGGDWDGVFYDNFKLNHAWIARSVVTGTYAADFDNNGTRDRDEYTEAFVGTHWSLGMMIIAEKTRNEVGTAGIIVGNGYNWNWDSPVAYNNGRMIITDWNTADTTNITKYRNWCANSYAPQYNINMGTVGSAGAYTNNRSRLAATLMGDGYHGSGESDNDWSFIWWFDEYSVNPVTGIPTQDHTQKGYLGEALGAPTTTAADVWMRWFTNGMAVYNATHGAVNVALGGTYRKIDGIQDPTTNDGSLVATVSLGDREGIILLNETVGSSGTLGAVGLSPSLSMRPVTLTGTSTWAGTLTSSAINPAVAAVAASLSVRWDAVFTAAALGLTVNVPSADMGGGGAINLAGWLHLDNGASIVPAPVVQAYVTDSSGVATTSVSSTATYSEGRWSFTGLDSGNYYQVKITAGSQVRYEHGAGKAQYSEITVMDNLQLPSGSAAAPGLRFASDPDSGLYLIGQGQLGLAVGGSKVLDVDAGGLYVESDCSALTFTDRTPMPAGLSEAYAAVRSVVGRDGKVVHEALHPSVRVEGRGGKPVGRNLSALISAQNEVIKDLVGRMDSAEVALQELRGGSNGNDN